MNEKRIALVLVMLTMMAWGCSRQEPSPAGGAAEKVPAEVQAQVDPDVLALVDGEPIKRDEYEAMVARTLQTDGTAEQVVSAETQAIVRRNVFNSMVEMALLRKAAKSAQLPLAATTIEAAAQQMVKQYRDTFDSEAEFQQVLADQGLTEERFQQIWQTQMQVEAFMEQKSLEGLAPITDEQISQWYDQHVDDFSWPQRVRLSQILIPLDVDAASLEVQAARSQVENLLNLLETGSETSFAQLAQDYSADINSASKGGDMGYVDIATLPAPLNSEVVHLQQNQVRTIRSPQFGYHVLMVTEMNQPLESASAEIHRRLIDQARVDNLTEWLDAQRSGAEIEILDADMEAMVKQGATASQGGP